MSFSKPPDKRLKMLVKYDDGAEKILGEGDGLYMPSGHMIILQKDIKMMDFNPIKERWEIDPEQHSS